ncbi:protein of unknown function (plasmid) [Caballeronia sp. S22]
MSRGRPAPNLLCFTLALRLSLPVSISRIFPLAGAPRGRVVGMVQVLSGTRSGPVLKNFTSLDA